MEESRTQVRTAASDDVSRYVALARAAQAWLRLRGLKQYVPAAHDEYTASIRSRIEAGTLFTVQDSGDTIGFFSLDASSSPWWPEDGTSALYLAGMVVARSARNRGIGAFILEWSATQAVRHGLNFLRLDCHAENGWLCRYYEDRGFVYRGRIEQHPGYYGCLFEREIERI